eukprot:CAMPEP_0118662482 /NCGR_PEP_ID=MMETSP0785-20121206/16856_1 /TAXON_ID=91992 /ORGANISM="Bolidomonas pacifica, Strain CCMP 1866" /LENGTH=213 /DNA_ID=CAMNT_0006556031 /DNA_START=144 /DNA_END=782 /DNA_ORIENTATION=+
MSDMFNLHDASDKNEDNRENNPMRDKYARMAAYSSRVKVLAVKTVKAKIRYSAYSSDVGEAVRPVAPKWVVNAAYGIVGVYVVGDIGFEMHHEKTTHGLEWGDWGVVRKGLHAATFQGIASLAIPTILIHSAVKYSTKGFSMYAPGMLKFGPSVVGLALIPFMPLFDHPAEEAIDSFFEKYVPKPVYNPVTENPTRISLKDILIEEKEKEKEK